MTSNVKQPGLLRLENNGRVTIIMDLDNRPYEIRDNHPNFALIDQAIKRKEWHKLSSLVDMPKAVKQFTSGLCEINGNQVYYNNKPVNNYVTEKILGLMRNNWPFESLLRFLEKLMDNPSFRAREELYKFLETEHLPITEDGDFLAYKAVTSDMMDKHTRTVKNEIGTVVEMDRKDVDDDPNHGCSYGFHAGSWNYVKGFGSGNDKYLIVKINPKDVVSVPNHDCRKLRTCKYEVVKFFDGELKEHMYTNQVENYNNSSVYDDYDEDDEYYDDDDFFDNDEDYDNYYDDEDDLEYDD